MSFFGYWDKLHRQMAANPDYLSGYRYAGQRSQLWQSFSVEGLQVMADAYFALYCENENYNSLGMSVYLQQLIDSRHGE